MSIVVNPGYTFRIGDPTDKISKAKLNELGEPEVVIEDGTIPQSWLQAELQTKLNQAEGNNILTNGNFLYWPDTDDTPSTSIASLTGTVADRLVTDGVLNTTTTVTSATAAFATGDIGKLLRGTGIPAGARIQSLNSSTSVQLNVAATATASSVSLTIARQHDYGAAARWVIANDPNRHATRNGFTPGQIVVPNNPLVFLRWAQSSPIAGPNPAYLGQRMALGLLAGVELCFTIWVRASSQLNVIPSVREFFGDPNLPTSAAVVADGDPVVLQPDTWTKVKYVVTPASIAGKTVGEGSTPQNVGPFLEFRIVVPQATSWSYIDFAQAQLIRGAGELAYDSRPFIQDWLEAQRYRARATIFLSDNVATKTQPFINFPVEFRQPIVGLNLSLSNIASGSGATLVADGNVRQGVVQDANHSVHNAQAVVHVDLELHAPS